MRQHSPAIGLRILLGLSLLVGFPAASRAEDDGGTRSVFAFGAGNRALALGGAYTALSDDASAPLWNPAGLGFVERRGFLASRTSLDGFGSTEYHTAIVFPSWRLGVLALNFRHFVVDGIELRDDRNVLLDDNLSDVETEASLAYARAVGKAWSLGSTIRVRRQSLAGFSATGVGLDFGLILRPGIALGQTGTWIDGLTAGVVVSNVLEPSIRLAQESVSDPTTARIGLAYQHRSPSGQALVLSVDLEKPRGTPGLVHVGAELQLHPLLALRVGVDDGKLTAGTGIRWQQLGIDYALVDNSLGPQHRFGFSYNFGPTVTERRQRSIAREEEALQVKLDESFARRQTAQITQLLEQAEQAGKEKRFIEALDLLSTVMTIDPDNSEAKSLLASALRQQGESFLIASDFAGAEIALLRCLSIAPRDHEATDLLRRCRSSSDSLATRSRERREEYGAAMDAFSTEDFPTAREAFKHVLSENPDDAEAASMLSRTNRAIERRVRGLLRLIARFIDLGEAESARELIDQARRLDPDNPEIRNLVATLDRQRRLRRTSSAGSDSSINRNPRPVPSVITAERRREIAGLYQRGLDAIELGQRNDALHYLELVWSADPDHEQAADYLKREYLARGLDAFSIQRLDDAIHFWQMALRVDPGDSRARGYLTRAQEQRSRSHDIMGDSE